MKKELEKEDLQNFPHQPKTIAISCAADHFLSFRVNASYQKNISVPVSFFRFYGTVQHIDTDMNTYMTDDRTF